RGGVRGSPRCPGRQRRGAPRPHPHLRPGTARARGRGHGGSDGEIAAGDVVGISGLQKEYDAQLRGRDEVEIFTVNASSCQDPLDCPEAERTNLATLEGGAPEPLKLT